MEAGILARTMARPTTLDRTSLLAGVHELAARDRHLARIVDEFGPPPLWARPRGFPDARADHPRAAGFTRFRCGAFRAGSSGISKVPLRLHASLRSASPRCSRSASPARRPVTSLGLPASCTRAPCRSSELHACRTRTQARSLVQIPGIGPWTAGVYLLMALRRPDVWPPGDLGLHKSMAEVRGMSAVPTSDEAAAIAARWSPWRAVAARLLWHSYLSRRAKAWDRQPRTRRSSPSLT